MKKNILLILLLASFILLTGCKKEEQQVKNDAQPAEKFTLLYKGVNIAPGEKFAQSSIAEEASYFEIESCAFEEKDKVYTYEGVQVTTNTINNQETVYSVYFLNSSVQTPEGVSFTSPKTLMLEKYGNSYDSFGEQYTYIRGKVKLVIMLVSDTVESIEYKYMLES